MAIVKRDKEILTAFTHRVRTMNAEQIARGFFPDGPAGKKSAAARIHYLVEQGYLTTCEGVAHPELELKGLTAQSRVGGPEWDFQEVSRRLKERWTEAPRETTVYLATPKAVELVGGVAPELKLVDDCTHDIHVAAVFLYCLRDFPHVIESWKSEDLLTQERRDEGKPAFDPTRLDKAPDALVSNYFVEFADAHEAQRVERIFRYCQEEELCLHLW